MRRRFFSAEDRESLQVGACVLVGFSIAIALGAVSAQARREARAEHHDHAWSQVESRYDVKVLDRSVAPPRNASRDVVSVAMQVDGQTRRCDVQAVRAETVVFCGADGLEAPRR